MARPLRNLYEIRAFARRRHRAWIFSMTCATLALAVLAISAAIRRFSASDVPPLWLAAALSSCFSLPGFFFGFMSVRGKWAWVAYAAVPMFANGILLALPWLLWRLRT